MRASEVVAAAVVALPVTVVALSATLVGVF
jgi:hypothetical protein